MEKSLPCSAGTDKDQFLEMKEERDKLLSEAGLTIDELRNWAQWCSE